MIVCCMLTLIDLISDPKDEKKKGSCLRLGHSEFAHLEAHMRGFRGYGHGHDGLNIYSELNRKFLMKLFIIKSNNKNLPWTTNALRIFKPKPVHAMMRTRRGESTGCIFIKRSIDCKQIDNAKANRKTPLKKAPAKIVSTWTDMHKVI